MDKYKGHTPGPWKSGGCVVWKYDGDMICDLSVVLRHPDETEANANLIADAPALLAENEKLRADRDFTIQGLCEATGCATPQDLITDYGGLYEAISAIALVRDELQRGVEKLRRQRDALRDAATGFANMACCGEWPEETVRICEEYRHNLLRAIEEVDRG